MALAAWTAITYLVPSRVRTTPSAQAVNHMGGTACGDAIEVSIGRRVAAGSRPACSRWLAAWRMRDSNAWGPTRFGGVRPSVQARLRCP
jgi:hypothetical protein